MGVGFPRAQSRVPVCLSALDDYLRLFESSRSEHWIVGEATAHYLASTVAVSRILAFNPESRFLVMLRNPIEFAISYHNQKLCELSEDVRDFEAAWNLQEDRARGRHIPANCCESEFLQYQKIGSFGSQIVRLKELVRPDRLQIVLLDDFVLNRAGNVRTDLGISGDPGRWTGAFSSSQ